jgi:hypothetical protein
MWIPPLHVIVVALLQCNLFRHRPSFRPGTFTLENKLPCPICNRYHYNTDILYTDIQPRCASYRWACRAAAALLCPALLLGVVGFMIGAATNPFSRANYSDAADILQLIALVMWALAGLLTLAGLVAVVYSVYLVRLPRHDGRGRFPPGFGVPSLNPGKSRALTRKLDHNKRHDSPGKPFAQE